MESFAGSLQGRCSNKLEGSCIHLRLNFELIFNIYLQNVFNAFKWDSFEYQFWGV